MNNFMPRLCEICGAEHRSLLQARMCCDVLAPAGETMADKMLRLVGHELADAGLINRATAIDAGIFGHLRALQTLKEKAALLDDDEDEK